MVRKINVKDHVHDDTFDLSVSNLDEVPVRSIASVPRIYTLDLSHNNLRTLGLQFAVFLPHITKLDVSNNVLTHLPENFGLLVNLKHLDLYKNNIQTLPLSFSDLGALRWLDLTDNPLVPQIAQVVGTCNDASSCNSAAKNIVKFMRNMKRVLEEENKKEQERKRQEELELQIQAQKKERQREKKKKKKALALANAAEEANRADTYDTGGTKPEIKYLFDMVNEQPKDVSNPVSGDKSSFFKNLFRSVLKFCILALIFIYFVDEHHYSNIRKEVFQAANTTSEAVTKYGGVHFATAKEKVLMAALIIKQNVGVMFEYIAKSVTNTYHWLLTDKTVQAYALTLKEYIIFFYQVMANLTYKVSNTIKESIK